MNVHSIFAKEDSTKRPGRGGTPPWGIVVVVADDDEQIRVFLKESLAEVGCVVFGAGNGKQAIAALQQRHVDLLILGLVMPEQQGIETLLWIRHNLPTLPVIAISGADSTYLELAKVQGARAVLTKPFSMPKVLDTIRSILNHGLP